MIRETAAKYFRYIQERPELVPGEYFFGKKFDVQYWAIIEWMGGEFFLDEYFRGLSMYGDELWLYIEGDKFAYWCEGAQHRPKSLDAANWSDIRANVEAVANMASNMLDGGLGVIRDGEFELRRIMVPWEVGFEPEKVVEGVKQIEFKGWRDEARFRPVYTFDSWGIEAWVKSG